MTCLVCDFGGTRIKTGLMNEGCLISSSIIPTLAEEAIPATMVRVAGQLESLCQESGIDPRDCAGIAAGFPALVDSRRNRVLDHYEKYRDAPEFDFNSWASQRWGIPIALENDARLALIGEWQHGAGRKCSQQAIITLGTGIGTAVLFEGSLLRGPHYVAGNLGGHLIIQAGGRRCVCGNRGCVEAYTGGGSLSDRVREMLRELNRENESPETTDYRLLFELADQGVDWASELRDRTIHYWAVLCANLINTFDLDRLIIGGGVMHAADFLLPELTDRVRPLILGGRQVLDLRAAEHPDTMALLGGEWLIREKTGANT
jgi:glucokinase